MSAPKSPNFPLTLTLFGPMAVQVHGEPLPRVRSRKGLWLLALLGLRASQPVEREWLAGMLWPDIDQSQAFGNLRPVLSELRSALGREGGRLQAPDRQTLLLDLQDAIVDVNLFDAAVVGKRPAELERAVALYRGPLLEGCDEEWVFQERALREQRCLQALQTLAETALAAGASRRAIAHFQRASELDPWNDSARRGWMEALARAGDRNAALQVYRDYAQLLRSDPRAMPDEKTSALYARLRAEMRRQADPFTEVAQQEAAKSPVMAGYLPHPLTALVGREDERTEVMARLRRARLVTLVGLGGIGKTRLAREVGAQSVSEFPDGVRLVSLESLTEGAQVIPQIAAVLELEEESGQPLRQSVIAHLRRKRLLLVLDNCEHLAEASAEAVGALLRECADLRILATGREALRIAGETLWSVPPLAVPDPEHLPQSRATLLRVLMGYEGVQLFVERAQAVEKTFQLTGANALAVARVCFQLEGIPFALELAAAQIRVVPIEQMATQLQSDLRLLVGGSRLTPARQQTLRMTLDWSCALLNLQERILLARLATLAGEWTLEAVEAICTGEEIESQQIPDLLGSLADRALIAYEERDLESVGRYRMLGVVRQYVAERIAGPLSRKSP